MSGAIRHPALHGRTARADAVLETLGYRKRKPNNYARPLAAAAVGLGLAGAVAWLLWSRPAVTTGVPLRTATAPAKTPTRPERTATAPAMTPTPPETTPAPPRRQKTADSA